jgi:uncharacterized protein with HEPN domain
MPREAAKYLFDIAEHPARLQRFVGGKTFDDYAADELLRAAVERQFEIIGEAINGLAKADPDSAQKISEYRRMIAFRNILIHGYTHVDDAIVWDIVESKLENLAREVAALQHDLS